MNGTHVEPPHNFPDGYEPPSASLGPPPDPRVPAWATSEPAIRAAFRAGAAWARWDEGYPYPSPPPGEDEYVLSQRHPC